MEKSQEEVQRFSVGDSPTEHGFEPWKDRFAKGLLLIDLGKQVACSTGTQAV